MVEQAHMPVKHIDHIVLVAGVNHVIVADRAAGLRDVAARRCGARARCCRQTGRTRRCPAQRPSADPATRAFLPASAVRGVSVKKLLPAAIRQHLVRLVGDVHVNGVVAVGTGDLLHERQCQHTSDAGAAASYPPSALPDACSGCGSAGPRRRRSPDRPWRSRRSWTACTSAQSGTSIRSRLASRRQILVRGHDVVQQIFVNHELIAPLLKRDAEHILVLHGRGTVGRVDLHNIVIALASSFSAAPAPRRCSRGR